MSRFEYFLQWLGLWFLAVAISWSLSGLSGMDLNLTGRQLASISILAMLGTLVVIAAFLHGFRSLYNSLKE